MRLLTWLGAAAFVAAIAACSAAGSGSDDSNGSPVGGGSGASSTGASSAGGAGAIGTGGSGTIILPTGGSGGSMVQECFAQSQEAGAAQLPVDVIWAIDTSGSMVEETAAVRDNMNQFSRQIVGSGVDARIVLIAEEYKPPQVIFGIAMPDSGICIGAPLGSGQCPADTNLPVFAHIFETVGSTDALERIISTYPLWKGQLRANSIKMFVVVTDDNSALSADDFIRQINALDGNTIVPNFWKFSGIYCYTNCPYAARPGSVYAQLVQKTLGVAGDLCLQQFGPVFDNLAAGVVKAARLDCVWEIPEPPPGEVFDPNRVNVVFSDASGSATTIYKVADASACGPDGGWYYNNPVDPTVVRVCESTCATIQGQVGARIDIEFGCATQVR